MSSACCAVIWLWLEIKELGLRWFWSLVPFTKGAILVHLFEPQPFVDTGKLILLSACPNGFIAFRFAFYKNEAKWTSAMAHCAKPCQSVRTRFGLVLGSACFATVGALPPEAAVSKTLSCVISFHMAIYNTALSRVDLVYLGGTISFHNENNFLGSMHSDRINT